ncbi:MAG: DUF2849 domain-containing protein [Rhodospirillales bacterium]|nr:MAG: DUF2849 domain-containing protein [Rhodospirillales bacterium]
MPKHVVTANRLIDGAVVYLTDCGGWSERIQDAIVADGKEADAALTAAADRAVADCIVVAPYLIDVDTAADSSVLRALRYRERIRSDGPSIHPEFAKNLKG